MSLLLCLQVMLCWTGRDKSLRGETDFRAFYTAGMMVRQGHAAELYHADAVAATQHNLFGSKGRTLPFLYPAIGALPFVPLSCLPFPLAFCAFSLINLLCFYATAHILSVQTASASYGSRTFFAAYLCFLPSAMALMQGQISFVLLLLLATANSWAEQERTFRAGLGLSLVLVKFQIALPLAMFLVLRRKWALLRSFVIGSVAVVGSSLLLTGWAGARGYGAALQTLGVTMGLHPEAAQHRFGMLSSGEPNLHGLLCAVFGAGSASVVCTGVLSAVVLIVAGRKVDALWSAVPAALLVSYHMQPYDLLLLLLPITFLAQRLSSGIDRWTKAPLCLFGGSLLITTVPLGAALLAPERSVWFVLAVCSTALLCTLSYMSNHPEPPALVRVGIIEAMV